MKNLSIILSLATASAAIDAVIYTNSQYCEGRWIGCLNLNPNLCCRVDQAGKAARWSAVPTGWWIETRTYWNDYCDENRVIRANSRGGDMCLDGRGRQGDFQSLGYGFLGRKAKRSEGEECQKPNALGLADGTQYNLTDMDDGTVTELLGYVNATGVADIPEQFSEFQM